MKGFDNIFWLGTYSISDASQEIGQSAFIAFPGGSVYGYGDETAIPKEENFRWNKIVTREWQFFALAIVRRGGIQPLKIADSQICSGPSPLGGFTLSLRYITMIFARTFKNSSCGLTAFWSGSIPFKA